MQFGNCVPDLAGRVSIESMVSIEDQHNQESLDTSVLVFSV